MADALAPPPELDLPSFAGSLYRPGEEGYDDARPVFNGMVDRWPALIARCASADDVVAAVNLARDRGLPLSVYGGGHGAMRCAPTASAWTCAPD